jgi:hypothetical protein
MSNLWDVLAFVGGSSALLTAVAWLLRAALHHSMSRDLVEFKSRIETSATTEIERLRSELRISEAEYGKRSTLLQEKRANLIDELYKKLIDYLAAAESFSSIIEWGGEPTKEEKAGVLAEKSSELFVFFLRHRIYFSAALCDQIQHLYNTVRVPTTQYRVWLAAVRNSDNSGGKFQESWDKAAQTIQKDVPPLMSAIEDEFRALLGVYLPAVRPTSDLR